MNKEILNIFTEMKDQEEEIKSIKIDQKEMLEIFIEQNEKWTLKQIKEGYKLWIKFMKDCQKALKSERERDEIMDIIKEFFNNI